MHVDIYYQNSKIILELFKFLLSNLTEEMIILFLQF
jgi:hypothetical protein